MSEELQVTLTPDKDMLVAQRNTFQKQVLDNTLDLRRHLQIQKVDPNYVREQQQGKDVPIAKLIENYTKGLVNAIEYVGIIDELLKADGEQTLEENIANTVGEGEASKPKED